MNRLQHTLYTRGPLGRLRSWAMGVAPRGCEGLNLYQVVRYTLKEVRTNKLNILGAAVTFNFLMAIPPTLLFLCSLVPYLPLKGVEEQIRILVEFITPEDPATRKNITGFVHNFLHNERRDILSFGILLTLFFSSNGMMGLMRSFDRSLPLYKKRNGVARRWTAIKLTVMLIVVAIITIAALILQSASINKLLARWGYTTLLIKPLSLLILVLLIFLSICIIYRYGPSLTQRLRFINPGSVLATALCLSLTAGFFYLVNNHILHYNIYGSIGTVIAMLVWLFLNTQVILLGFMLNVGIITGSRETGRRAQKKEEEILEAPPAGSAPGNRLRPD